MVKIINGKDVKPLDKVVIHGTVQIVESCYQSSDQKINHLRMISGLTWPVRNDEKIIYVGTADDIITWYFQPSNTLQRVTNHQ